MANPQESLRDKLILAAIQTLVFGALLAIFGFWLNLRLERYKTELVQDTEKLKVALIANTPLIQQRRAAYLDIQQSARKINGLLEIYYSRAQQPRTGRVLSDQLEAVEDDLIPSETGFSSRRGNWVTNQEVVEALREMVLLRQKYQYVCSDNVNSAIDDFLTTVMKDIRLGEQPGNDTESFHTTARANLIDALNRLNLAISEALQLEKLPIQ